MQNEVTERVSENSDDHELSKFSGAETKKCKMDTVCFNIQT